MWSLLKPSPSLLARFVAQHQSADYSYDHVGRVADTHPSGFDRDMYREVIGHGAADFAHARALFNGWRQFPAPWTAIYPNTAAPRAGQTLAMVARAFGVWWTNACRVVYTIDEPTRYGFAYGTLLEHVECGEEQFLLEFAEDGAVWYDIRSFSRPRSWAVRIGYPLARRMQRRFARESIAAMRRQVAEGTATP
jgi:uncharacterized protein (UPF0548 family)